MSDNKTSPTLTTHNVKRFSDHELRHYHDRPKMILLVGYPGVGKSYYCTGASYKGAGSDNPDYTPDGTLPMGEDSQLMKDFPKLRNATEDRPANYIIISTDEIIREMAKDGYMDARGYKLNFDNKPHDMSVADYVYKERKEQIRNTRNELIKKAAVAGKHIVVDALNVSNESRYNKIARVLLQTDDGGARKRYGIEAVVIHPPESMGEYQRRMESRASERRNTTTTNKLRDVAMRYEDPIYDKNLDLAHEFGQWPSRNNAIPKPECYKTGSEKVGGAGRNA